MIPYNDTPNQNAVVNQGPSHSSSAIAFIGISPQNPSSTLDPQILYPYWVGMLNFSAQDTQVLVQDMNGDGLPDMIILDATGGLKIMFQVPLP